MDNSRQYGNGLVKFEPNDLNKGKVVDLRILTTQENAFILRAFEKLLYGENVCNQMISILDDFFRDKFIKGKIDLRAYIDRLEGLILAKPILKEVIVRSKRIKQLNFMYLFEQFADNPIVENYMVHEDEQMDYLTNNSFSIDYTKNVLISLVKADNIEQYLDQSAKIYYTGKKFPSTVALNKLYYFMPYIKRKGIRDLYLIKIARVGTRKEGQPDNDPNDLRLVFEIEFVKKLFNDYRPVELEIWHTFTDTTMKEILDMY